MRLNLGSFAVSFAPSNDPTRKPDEDQFIHMGSAKFGSSYLKLEKIGNDKLSRPVNKLGTVRRVNWDLKFLLYLASYTYLKGYNLVSTLAIIWKFEGRPKHVGFSDIKKYEPESDHKYGVSSMSLIQEYDHN